MENCTVPDFISTNTLKDLSSKIRANKRERISEYLEEKKLLPNFKNIKKAKRALEVRISNEVLNPDYSNISAEKEFSNMVNFREKIEENVRTMLKINLNSRTEDELKAELKDVLQKIFDTYSGFVTVIDNQISLFDTVRDEDILKELDELDISNLTPLDALNTLYRLQNLRKNRWHM